MKRFFCNGKKDFCDERLCKDNCEFYDGSGGEYVERKTNADRIRAMTDEELAHELALVAGWDREQYKKAKAIGIEKVILDILQQPCEGD